MPALGPDAVQSDTSTFVVTIGAGQVVVVYELAAVGPLAAHVAAGTFVVLLVLQVVVVLPLAAVGPVAVQLGTGTFVVLLAAMLPQVVVV